MKLKFRNYIGIAVGMLFIASSLVPVGVYNYEGAANISGGLWNFMIPTGWFYMLVGIVLLFHKRLGLENKRLAFVMFEAGLFIRCYFAKMSIIGMGCGKALQAIMMWSG